MFNKQNDLKDSDANNQTGVVGGRIIKTSWAIKTGLLMDDRIDNSYNHTKIKFYSVKNEKCLIFKPVSFYQ